MFVANVKRRWSESSLPRSQVSDLYSSLGSFLACLMSADTTDWYPYWPPSPASRSGYDVRPRSRYSCSKEKELYVLRACGSPSREAPGSTSVWRPPNLSGRSVRVAQFFVGPLELKIMF